MNQLFLRSKKIPLFIKQSSFAVLILGLLILFQNAVLAQITNNQAQQRKPAIMILGSYHMNSPGKDVANMKVDDVLQSKRQREIEELAALLKKFNPNKIALEIKPFEESEFQNNYQEYVNGNYQLKGNEREQLGFRLAKELKHKKIYAVNWNGMAPGDFANYNYWAFAEKNNQSELLENFKRKAEADVRLEEDIQRKGTIIDIFRYINGDKVNNQWHQNYYDLLDIAASDQYIGANWLQSWYGRNLKIFTNIMRITESPNDRILVVYGAGHLKFLKEFAQESGKYEVEDASKYLNASFSAKR